MVSVPGPVTTGLGGVLKAPALAMEVVEAVEVVGVAVDGAGGATGGGS